MLATTAWELKVGWAHRHVEALRLRLQEYLLTNPYHLQHVTTTSGPGLRLAVHREPPAELSLTVGDVLHNLRSALDSRMVGAAEQLAGRVLSDAEERAIALPLASSQADFADQTRRWVRALGTSTADKLKRVALALQPFAAPSGYWMDTHDASEATAREFHFATIERLTRLATLSNTDKHRRVHLMWWSFDSVYAYGDVEDAEWLIAAPPWSSGTTVATLMLPGDWTDDDAHVRAQLTVVLPDRMDIGGDVADDLDNVAYFAQRGIDILDWELTRA